MTFPTEWNNNKCSKPPTNYNILYISIRRILPACIIHSQHMVRSCLSGLGWYPQSLGPGKHKKTKTQVDLSQRRIWWTSHGVSWYFVQIALPCWAPLSGISNNPWFYSGNILWITISIIENQQLFVHRDRKGNITSRWAFLRPLRSQKIGRLAFIDL